LSQPTITAPSSYSNIFNTPFFYAGPGLDSVPELDLKEDRKQQVEQLGDSVEEQEEEGGLDRKRHSIYIRTVRPCPNVSATPIGQMGLKMGLYPFDNGGCSVMLEQGGARGATGPPIFGRSLNPIPTGEVRLSPPITTGTPNVFHLPASLVFNHEKGAI
jgi:hypothetical protein